VRAPIVLIAVCMYITAIIVFGVGVGELIDVNSLPRSSQIRRVCVGHEGVASVSGLPLHAEVFVVCRDGYGEWR
jgi:hypothetical protein